MKHSVDLSAVLAAEALLEDMHNDESDSHALDDVRELEEYLCDLLDELSGEFIRAKDALDRLERFL